LPKRPPPEKPTGKPPGSWDILAINRVIEVPHAACPYCGGLIQLVPRKILPASPPEITPLRKK
jgi:hypothetical protein